VDVHWLEAGCWIRDVLPSGEAVDTMTPSRLARRSSCQPSCTAHQMEMLRPIYKLIRSCWAPIIGTDTIAHDLRTKRHLVAASHR
jgi:hypothetical protein